METVNFWADSGGKLEALSPLTLEGTNVVQCTVSSTEGTICQRHQGDRLQRERNQSLPSKWSLYLHEQVRWLTSGGRDRLKLGFWTLAVLKTTWHRLGVLLSNKNARALLEKN
jgi:hypothetical protein